MGVTTTTNYGRAQVAWPDYAHDGGTALHTKIVNGIKKLSDNLSCRYTEPQTIADTASFDFTHNFNLSLTELDIQIYESNARISNEDKQKNYAISELSANQIRFTNQSGGSKTFFAMVFGHKLEPGKHVGWAQTTNATQATLITYDIPNDKAALVVARICARKDGTTANAYELKFLVEDNAGTTTVTQMEKTQLEDDSDWDVTIDASSGTARVRVTGEAATTISWTAVLESTFV